MKITLDKPTSIVKQREVKADISEINVNRIVVNYRLKEVRAFTDGGGGPLVLVGADEFDTVAGDNLNLKALGEKIKTKVLSGDTGRPSPAVPARAAARGAR
jgi:hypothetical protein